MAATAFAAVSLLVSGTISEPAYGQSTEPSVSVGALPANWRDIKDGVDGYPAGPMLEIAVRHVPGNKLEMFKWRSEFIAMLSAQPGPLIEREWKSILGVPANSGAGTWTGMTWWENQQRWHDMANILFPTPVVRRLSKTIDSTLIFAKPLDKKFDLATLGQSGDQVVELGILSFPSASPGVSLDVPPPTAAAYLQALAKNGVETYRFAIYKNLAGVIAPYSVAYNKNGPPATSGENWFVYMATYTSAQERARLQSTGEVSGTFNALRDATVKEHSDVQVLTRSTSLICIKTKTNTYSLDPDDCHVGVMGSGDLWAASYGERPQPCRTDYNVVSMLPPRTCDAVGGHRISAGAGDH